MPALDLERPHFSPVFQADGQALRGYGARVVVPNQRSCAMRYVFLWLLGIPIPVLILLAIFKVI